MRVKIILKQPNYNEQFCGKIQIDEYYFGGYDKEKRDIGAAGKIPVFGILKRNGDVFTQIFMTQNGKLIVYNPLPD